MTISKQEEMWGVDIYLLTEFANVNYLRKELQINSISKNTK